MACRWIRTPSVHHAYNSRTISVHQPYTMSPGFRVACEWLASGLGGGSGWLFSAIPHSALRNPHSPQGVSHKHPEYNSPPAPTSGWSGGTLDKPWTCPGTIEHLQTPVFDQPSLSRPLSCGISAAERFGCGADLWSAGPRKLRLCGPCSAKPDLWAALPSRSGFCILPSTFAWGWLWVASGGWARLLIFVGGEFCIQHSAFCLRKSASWPAGILAAIPPAQRPT